VRLQNRTLSQSQQGLQSFKAINRKHQARDRIGLPQHDRSRAFRCLPQGQRLLLMPLYPSSQTTPTIQANYSCLKFRPKINLGTSIGALLIRFNRITQVLSLRDMVNGLASVASYWNLALSLPTKTLFGLSSVRLNFVESVIALFASGGDH
jgi:hypothetical protein